MDVREILEEVKKGTMDTFEWFDAATNTIRPLNGTYKILYGNSSNEKDLQTCSIQIQ